MRSVQYNISEEFNNIKVEHFLMQHQGISRAVIKKLKNLPDGMLKNGVHVRTIDLLSAGDILEINLPEEGRPMPLCHIDVPVLHNDQDIIVFNKPYNMPVHQSGGHIFGTLDGVYARICKENNDSSTFRAINRLDKDTTGTVVVAKNQLTAGIIWKKVSKVYIGIVYGHLEKKQGVISVPIEREVPMEIKRIVSPDGQEAITEYNVISEGDSSSLVEFTLHTGRTHQIRVHMSHIGHFLLGDQLYGDERDESGLIYQALHCKEISLIHPITKEKLVVTAPLPNEVSCFMEKDNYKKSY